MDWKTLAFDELSPRELYAALQLREAVFALEQDCLYQDLDGRDPDALHLLGLQEGELVAYARLFAPETAGGPASIGRVVTSPAVRGRGWGRALMEKALDLCRERFPGAPVLIGAQCYLETFYRSLGFRTLGAPYDLDGIPHVDMERPPDAGKG